MIQILTIGLYELPDLLQSEAVAAPVSLGAEAEHEAIETINPVVFIQK